MSDKAVHAIKSALLSNGWTDPEQCDYGPTADAILAALAAARIAVTELPEPESTGHVDDGDFDWWSFPWGVTADSTGQVSDETGCELTVEDARGLAASWLAAAAAAEAVSA